MSDQLLLSVRNLTKRYAVKVLDDVSIDFHAGEIHALLGANGAGKSTLCRIIAGLTPSSSGTMQVAGQVYAPQEKRAAEAAGVQIVQQELNQIATLSVAENIMIGRLPARFGVVDRGELHRRARIALDRFGLQEIDTHAITGSLGVGRQQMIEIATALDRDCRVLILDEPTAALSAGESETLFTWLNKLRQQGVGIIYISHRLDEVARLSDRITVLRDGKFICTRPTADVDRDAMVDLMTGESTKHQAGDEYVSHQTDRIAMRVEGMSRGRWVRDVSFSVHRGERLGIAGLVGAGRTELLRLIFAADRADSGEVYLNDESTPRRFADPSDAVAAGLAMVTEDRKENGLLLSQSIRANTTLASMNRLFSAGGWIRGAAERKMADRMRESMETRCTSIEQTVGTLSGGNQQKVAVAKWLVRDADIFLFDEPTRGIDVAARRRIYRLFETLARDEKSLVIVSSDLEELMETCDRIAVMSAGRMVASFARGDWSPEQIMQAAFAPPDTVAVG
ncbi:sugar ABC transporter ATP-binding protein [Rosistilla oblonga]|uniref:Ribose import ATP-binding protein RbsA n=1 Tax=Rosistilla oblonga TaxID=2527990 RepID=A0A518ITX9_9BACT|nr:sugar ABC transporter ATP-binding protein [Rosistilla oblonga]QDV56543.1 Ribose import ATP-binding protein RbsA [Rosistilla oblonga]